MSEGLWEELQIRAQRAAKLEEQEGLSFAERCALVILWGLQQNDAWWCWYGLENWIWDSPLWILA